MPDLSDPDHIALIYLFGIDSCLYTGRLDEARRVADAHDEVTSGLTPHHRLHAVSLLIAVAQAEGRWEAARNLTARAEPAVADNVATPMDWHATETGKFLASPGSAG